MSIPMQVTGIFADTVYLDFEGNEGDVFEEEEKNLIGIPITEELVLQIGFDKDNLPTYFAERYIKDGVRLQICNGEGRLVYPDGELCGIRYLHQLQNAYFMLTGKQLKVQL